ncbi:MAG: hypothetical protein KF805_03700 [Phycisphaeraceae bacterium]|nr:hypothetical protein [Phycisphaeraceae bacterium]
MSTPSLHSGAPSAAPRCETCGYELLSVLDSSGPAASCPECGTPSWKSGPALRPGSPWQQRPGLGAFALTLWLIISRPAVLFRAMEATGRHAWSLLVLQSVIAAVAFLSPWSGVLTSDPVRQLRFARTISRMMQIVGAVFIQILVLAACLCAASLILGFLLRSYGRVRGWNPPPGTTRSIAAHAAIGWTVVAGVVWSLLTAWFVATLIVSAAANPSAARALGQASGWLATTGGRYGLLPLPVLIFGAGGILVARIALTGLQACRYANAPDTARFFDPTVRETTQ